MVGNKIINNESLGDPQVDEIRTDEKVIRSFKLFSSFTIIGGTFLFGNLFQDCLSLNKRTPVQLLH